MSSSHKRKGTRVENEIVKLFQAEGFNAKRQPLSGALIDFPHDVQVKDLYEGTNIEVKARKSGEGFTQLDKWKGSADLLILKRDFQKPMVYLTWDFFKEFLNEYKENRESRCISESGEQADIQHTFSGEATTKEDSQKSTSKIPSRKFNNGQGMRQGDRKSWPKNQRKIASRTFKQNRIDGATQLQSRWEYLKNISEGK